MSRYLALVTILVLHVAYVTPSLGSDRPNDTAGVAGNMAVPELNHLYIVLPQSVIDSVARTPFINVSFSAFEQKKVDAGSESWSGTYLLGQRAYLEFFSPAGLEGSEAGQAGIGLSTSRLGDIQTAKSRLALLAGDRAEDGLRVRVLEGDTVSWFHYIDLVAPDTGAFFSWLMECTGEYLQTIGVDVDSTRRFDRHAYLMAKTSPSAIVPSNSTLFDDIVEIDLELTHAEHADFALFSRALGVEGKTEAAFSTYDFGNCIVKVQTNDPRTYCLRKVVCSMIEAMSSPMRISFGPEARVELDHDLATWYFGL